MKKCEFYIIPPPPPPPPSSSIKLLNYLLGVFILPFTVADGLYKQRFSE